MSLKHILFSILFVFFAIYIAFLNPHESTVHLTQNHTVKLPTVILLITAVFTGVLFSIAIFWTSNLKNSFSSWRSTVQKNRSDKKLGRVESLYKKAENFFLSDRTEKALSYVDKILEVSPTHIPALSLKGKILCSQGEKVLAANFQKKALELEPQSISILFDLAATYSKAGQFADHINLLKKIHWDNPKAIQPLILLRDAFLKQEDWKNILATQEKILSLMRSNKGKWEEELKNKSYYLFSRGGKNLELEKYDSAISDFKQAIKTWKKNYDAHLFLGDVYLKIGKPKVAIKKWVAGFEQTHNIACLIRVQKVYLEKENAQDLIEIYQGAMDPTKPERSYKFVLLLALLHLEHNQIEKAKIILEENPTRNELLGTLLLAQANKPAHNGSNLHADLDLIRDAIFLFSTVKEDALK